MGRGAGEFKFRQASDGRDIPKEAQKHQMALVNP